MRHVALGPLLSAALGWGAACLLAFACVGREPELEAEPQTGPDGAAEAAAEEAGAKDAGDAGSGPSVAWAREILLDGPDAGGLGAHLALLGSNVLLLAKASGTLADAATDGADVLFVTLSEDGDLVSSRLLGGPGEQSSTALVTQGSRVFGSWLTELSAQDWSSHITRLDLTEPVRTINSRGKDHVRALAPWGGQGGYFYAGSTHDGGLTSYAMYGSIEGVEKTELYAGTDAIISGAVGASDGVVISGRFRGSLHLPGSCPTLDGPRSTAFVAKVGAGDNSLECKWAIALPATGDATVYALAGANEDVVVGGGVVGSFQDAGGAERSGPWIAKLSISNGELRWLREFPVMSGGVHFRAFDVDSEGRILATGWLGGAIDFGGGVLSVDGATNAYLLSLHPDGSHDFSLRFGRGDVRGYSVRAGTAGTIYLGGDVWVGGELDLPGAAPRTHPSSRSFVLKVTR